MSTSDNRAPHDPAAGAHNLLTACVGVCAGDSVLLVAEPAGSRHYDPSVAAFLAERARNLGAHVIVRSVAPAGGPEDAPESLREQIEAADHTLFLNRIGDQLRFAPLPGAGSKTVVYTLDMDQLGSAFAVTPYAVWQDILGRLIARLDAARSYSIRCPRGTDLRMQPEGARTATKPARGFTVGSFPVMVVPPIPASRLCGRLVISHALTQTGVHAYDDGVIPLDSPLTLNLENGTILGIEGDAALVAKVKAQFARVAAQFGGEQWALDSWHAGINPFTFFPRPALSDLGRWESVAFGSPRYAHFHMCGPAPGDICGQVFDPTIVFDDAVLWQDGRAAFLTPDDKHRLLEHRGIPRDALEQPRGIGVG